jgi:predicted ester cyclase
MKIRYRYGLKSFVIAFCILVLSCGTVNTKGTTTANILSPDPGMQMQLQNNKALVLKLYQALNDTNWTVAKTLIHPDFKHHFVKDSGFGVTSWSGFEKGYRMSQKAFPDWKLTAINVVAEGDYVSVLLNGQGTHRGEFVGIPATNKKAGAPVMLLHQIKDGKIIADWEIMNTSSFLEQLKKQ